MFSCPAQFLAARYFQTQCFHSQAERLDLKLLQYDEGNKVVAKKKLNKLLWKSETKETVFCDKLTLEKKQPLEEEKHFKTLNSHCSIRVNIASPNDE